MPIGQDQLRHELEQVEKRLKSLKAKREEAEREERIAEQERDAYRVLLGMNSDSHPPIQQTLTGEDDSSDAKPSQRTYMRTALKNIGDRGMSPAELYKAVKVHGVKRNYVHSTLFRWKESGVVTERNGRYSLNSVQ